MDAQRCRSCGRSIPKDVPPANRVGFDDEPPLCDDCWRDEDRRQTQRETEATKRRAIKRSW